MFLSERNRRSGAVEEFHLRRRKWKLLTSEIEIVFTEEQAFATEDKHFNDNSKKRFNRCHVSVKLSNFSVVTPNH